MIRSHYIIIVALFTLSCLGCMSDGPRPNDLPKLYPCSISILQEGRPLVGALVVLTPVDGSRDWYSVGTTNSQGIASINASSRWKGVPKGKYKVFVSKYETEKIEPKKRGDDPVFIVYSLVEPIYTNPVSTPFVLEISNGTEMRFDIGKTVKIKM